MAGFYTALIDPAPTIQWPALSPPCTAASAATFLVPLLVVAVVVGLIQTIFSVQESSISFLPKLAALMLVTAIAGEGLMLGLADYLERGLTDMVGAIR
ncbi:flagellar biosynthetic protein FliQ [Sandarakinorhabdus sp.]|uniref:flagellar biosynthetic protein FliQ n=1 Tax=Sandarakinorhabdus sp. TaxID=1916663 RepID=UPI0035662D8C